MKCNGKLMLLPQECTLLEFLAKQQYDGKAVAVERNGEIVPRTKYGSVILAEDDCLEIVRFVGGG